MSYSEKLIKRIFDFILALFFLVLLIIPIVTLIVIATIHCKEIGLFTQKRVGRKGMLFTILKIKTIKPSGTISKYCQFLRDNKLDELPQLFNIFIGNMSFVGPRPDLKGYADELKGENKMLLDYKPGLTSPASLLYFDEEKLLSDKESPMRYYNKVIWPEKVSINLTYFKKYSLAADLKLILNTFWFTLFKKELFRFNKYYRP
ncbi:MAG: sugar transferase [Flavobacteriaceae bacterium]